MQDFLFEHELREAIIVKRNSQFTIIHTVATFQRGHLCCKH